jgi:TonB family protein
MKIQAGSVVAAMMLALTGSVDAEESAGATASRSNRFTELAVAAQPPITWPGEQDRDALVYVRISVSPQGKVMTAEVDDGGFHELRFAEEAVNAVRLTSFKPAQYDGTPVATTAVIPISFLGSGRTEDGRTRASNEVSTEVRIELQKIQELYKNGKTEEGNTRAETLLRKKVRYAYEYYLLKTVMAESNLKAGREHDALQAAFDATRSTQSRRTRGLSLSTSQYRSNPYETKKPRPETRGSLIHPAD